MINLRADIPGEWDGPDRDDDRIISIGRLLMVLMAASLAAWAVVGYWVFA